jgi:transcriptional regulator with XRE-family HTH domain
MNRLADMSAFGDLFGQLLEARQFTVRSFGTLVKSSKSSVNAIVLGNRTPPLEALEQWCDTLNLRGDERQRFIDLAALAHLPTEVRPKFESWYEEHQQLKSDYADLLSQVRRVADK